MTPNGLETMIIIFIRLAARDIACNQPDWEGIR